MLLFASEIKKLNAVILIFNIQKQVFFAMVTNNNAIFSETNKNCTFFIHILYLFFYPANYNIHVSVMQFPFS